MRKTSLYRHFDGDGRLLYVGISMSALARLTEHKYSPWHESIVRIELEWHPSRQHALYAEAVAIRDEKPIYNVLKPLPMEPYVADVEDEPLSRVLGPCLTANITAGGEHRTILYTVIPSGPDAQARLDDIAASVADGFGVAFADLDEKADGFIHMFRLAQYEGTRILTDRPDAFSEEARALISKRGMYLASFCGKSEPTPMQRMSERPDAVRLASRCPKTLTIPSRAAGVKSQSRRFNEAPAGACKLTGGQMSDTYEDGFKAGLAAAAKVADYWAEGHWRVTHDKRSRFSIYDMQRVNVTTAQEIAKDIRELKLCEGEADVAKPEQRTIANAVMLKHES